VQTQERKVTAMVETIAVISTVEIKENSSENFNVPVIFVEDRDEVNGQIINDHYSPSVRNLFISKPIDTTSGFGFHLSRSKWDPYPYISRVDKDSYAASSGLREGDCLLEVKADSLLIRRLILNRNETKRLEDTSEGRREKVLLISSARLRLSNTHVSATVYRFLSSSRETLALKFT
jgi:hypothetical protein